MQIAVFRCTPLDIRFSQFCCLADATQVLHRTWWDLQGSRHAALHEHSCCTSHQAVTSQNSASPDFTPGWAAIFA